MSLPWLAPLSWGAGLVLAALGASAIIAGAPAFPPIAVGVALVALGVVALVWGGACLTRGRILAPQAALTGVLAALLSIAAVVLVTGGRASIVGAAVAVALLLVVAALSAAQLRRPTGAARSVPMIPLLIAATLIALTVTPTLGAVQDSALLRDDGTVVVIDPHEGH